MSKKKNIIITKASGKREAFSEIKLRRSLKRTGASPDLVSYVAAEIKSELRDGVSTSDIYSRAFSLLLKKHRPTTARYHLKRALMELGPTGYPFEKFVGELFRTRGFQVEVGVIVQGVCVSHEIDVVGLKDDRHIMVECKFHNRPGVKSDVKVALYVQARFEDVERQWKKKPHHAEKFHEVWLVTNTKLTSDATRYAACVSMKAIGWNYPLGNGLEYLIEKYNLHPVTCLTSLSKTQKRLLLERGIVTCKGLLKDSRFLTKIGLRKSKISVITDEINHLCQS